MSHHWNAAIYDHMHNSLREIASIEYDWDGESALPPRPDSLEMAAWLASDDPAIGTDRLLQWAAMPNVTLGKNGVISVLLRRSKRRLILSFPCRGVVSYQKFCKDSGFSEDGQLRAGDDEPITHELAEEVSGLIDWLVASRGTRRRSGAASGGLSSAGHGAGSVVGAGYRDRDSERRPALPVCEATEEKPAACGSWEPGGLAGVCCPGSAPCDGGDSPPCGPAAPVA